MRKERRYTIKLTSKELNEVINALEFLGVQNPGFDNDELKRALTELKDAWDKVPA